MVFSLNTYSVVFYKYADQISFFTTADFDLSAFRRELYSIAEQVIEDLFETNAIGVHR